MACKNGLTEVNSLTPFPAGAATDSWLVKLTHWTCGNRHMCLNDADGLPAVDNLSVQQIDNIRSLGNGTYCCDVRIICELTYQQISGSACCPNYCMVTEKCVATTCVPVTSADPVTLTPNGASVAPLRVSCRCNTTNMVALEVSFSVEQAAAVNANADSKKK